MADTLASLTLERLRRLRTLQERKTAIESSVQRGVQIYYTDPVGFARDCIRWPEGRFLTAYQQDVLTTLGTPKPGVDVHRSRVAVRGPHGLGKCVHYAEPVRLADGSLVPALDLVGTSFDVQAVDPTTGDVRQARAFATDNGIKPVVRITTAKGRTITRTLNHPIWGDIDPKGHPSPQGRGRVRPEGGWVATGDLKPGSVIAAYLGNAGAVAAGDEHELTVLGALLADGGLTARSVRFSQAPGPMLDSFTESAAVLGCKLTYGGGVDYSVVKAQSAHSRKPNPVMELCRAWRIFGHGSRAKRMPDFVWRLDDKSLALLLNRMFACDGWASSGARPGGKVNREVGYASACYGLAQDVQRALLRLGIVAELRPRKASWTYKGIKKTSKHYVVAVHDVSGIRAFAERVGILGKEAAVNALLATCDTASTKEQQGWQSFRIPTGFAWERVASVEVLDPEPTVAITVPGPETFLTDFIEHNTMLAATTILWFALTREAAGVDWKVATTAGSWHQLTQYLWPEIHRWTNAVRWDVVRDGRRFSRAELQHLNLKLGHGHVFAGASANAALIEGAHADSLMFVYDESKAIPAATFDACEGAFSGTGEALALAISTPGDPNGRFYDIHARRPGYEDWHARHVTLAEAIAAGRISEDWAEQRRKQWGEHSAAYVNRVLGDFHAGDEDSVVPLRWVELANERWTEWDTAGRPEVDGPHIVGVDVARSGEDKTVIAIRHGPVMVELRRSSKEDTMQTVGRVKGHLDTDPAATASVDIIGIGAGVYDRLREQGARVEPFTASAGTKKRDATNELGFANVRAAAWWTLREQLDPAAGSEVALPPDDLLLGDLTAPKWKILSGGKIAIESKDDIKKRIGRSTDDGDAVVQSYWRHGTSWSDAYGVVSCEHCGRGFLAVVEGKPRDKCPHCNTPMEAA